MKFTSPLYFRPEVTSTNDKTADQRKPTTAVHVLFIWNSASLLIIFHPPRKASNMLLLIYAPSTAR